MTDTVEAVAQRLRAAFESGDLSTLAPLLRADVRWGGEEETPETCHSRADVLAWYGKAAEAGIRATVTETLSGTDAVLLGLRVTGRDPVRTRRGQLVYQVFRIADGQVADIRGYPNRDEAVATMSSVD